jgi:hypothetical protein
MFLPRKDNLHWSLINNSLLAVGIHSWPVVRQTISTVTITPTFFLVAIKPASDILMNMKKLIDVTNESYMEGTCCICGLFYSVYWCHTRLVHMRFTAGVNICHRNCLSFESTPVSWCGPCYSSFLVSCVVLCFYCCIFFNLCLVSCVHYVANVSGLSIRDCRFGFIIFII